MNGRQIVILMGASFGAIIGLVSGGGVIGVGLGAAVGAVLAWFIWMVAE